MIGEVRIPLDKIQQSEHKKNNCVEAILTAKLRKCQTVGTIKVVIAFSNNKFEGTEEAVKISMNEHSDEQVLDFETIVNKY